MKRRITSVLSIVAMIAVVAGASVLGGCGSGGLSGTLTLAGSTTVLPIAQEAADMFMEENPDANVTVQGGGSSVGVTQVGEGTVQIGNASRDLKDDEKDLGLVDHKIALDMILVVVNKDVNVDELSADQTKDVFIGNITNWKDVGGEDAPITVIVRDEASGTREIFDEKVLGEDQKPVSGAQEANSNGIVREKVASTPGAIGYISFGYADDSVKALKYDGVEGSLETAGSGEYAISRFLHMFTKGEPDELAQAYLDFVLSDEFQDEVVSQEYIPMTEVEK